MSEVYIKEPNTKGSAVLRTTHGDLEIEMWATECPKACRNFCQLILEGYYNGTFFARVIRDFVVQGGDKTGSGDSSESIYGQPYPDEIHPRLKFRYRGMMGIASAGANTKTNGSQFFICMDRAPSLDRKHTLFAKVVGQTIYNLVRLNEVEVDKNDRPVDPPRIIRAELTWDPFGDLEPRYQAPTLSISSKKDEKHRREAIKNKRVLSFGGDDDDEEDDDAKASTNIPGKASSARHAPNDPKLPREAKEASRSQPEQESRTGGMPPPTARRKAAASGSESDSGAEKACEKEKAPASEESSGSSSEDDGKPVADSSQKRNAQIQRLKRDIASINKGDEPQPIKAKRMSAWEELRQGFVTRGQRQVEKPTNRKDRQAESVNIVGKVKTFQERVRDEAGKANELEAADDVSDRRQKELQKEREKDKKESEEGTLAAIWEEGEEESTTDWLSGGGLKFHVDDNKKFQLEVDRAIETIEIFDPLAAKGDQEVLNMCRKRRAEQLKPSLRRKDPLKTW